MALLTAKDIFLHFITRSVLNLMFHNIVLVYIHIHRFNNIMSVYCSICYGVMLYSVAIGADAIQHGMNRQKIIPVRYCCIHVY